MRLTLRNSISNSVTNGLKTILNVFGSAPVLSGTDYIFPDDSGNDNSLTILNNTAVHLNGTDNYLRIIGIRSTGQQPISWKGWIKILNFDSSSNYLFSCGGNSSAVKGVGMYLNLSTMYVQSSNGTTVASRNFGSMVDKIIPGEYCFVEFYWTGLTVNLPVLTINGTPINANANILEWTGLSEADFYMSKYSAGSLFDFAYTELSFNSALVAKYLCFESSLDYLLDVSGLGHNATVYGTKSTIRDAVFDGEPFALTHGFSLSGSDIIPPDLSNPGYDVNGNVLTYPAGSGITDYLENLFTFPDDADIKKLVFEFYESGTPKQLTFSDIDSATSLNLKKTKVGEAITRLRVIYHNLFSAQSWGDSLGNQLWSAVPTMGERLNRTFTVFGYGGYTSTEIKAKYLLFADYAKTQIIWVGSNNSTAVDVILADIAEMVSHLTHNRYIIMTTVNGGYSVSFNDGPYYPYYGMLEESLLSIYGDHFLNNRRLSIDNYNFNNIVTLTPFVQPAVGANVQIEVTDATFLTTENTYSITDYPAKSGLIRIGDMTNNSQYTVISVDSGTLLTIRLDVEGAYLEGETVPADTLAFQEFDYFFKTKDATASTFRIDKIHMSAVGIEFIAKLIIEKMKALNI